MVVEFEIVPLTAAHAPGYRACLDAVARERRYLALVEALPADRTLAFVEDGVARHEPQFAALAEGTVVGWADIRSGWNPATAHCGTLGMGVHPDWRGRGLGRALLEACLERAAGQGITRVEADVRADNEPAIALYRRLGFVVEGTRRNALRIDGTEHDLLLMSHVTTPSAPAGRGPARAGSFLYARDLQVVAAFYEGLVPMVRQDASDERIVLATADLQLIVLALPPERAAEVRLASPPEERWQAAARLFFTVADIGQACAAAERLGGKVLATEYRGPGFKAWNARDPEGNIFQVRVRT